MNSRSLMPVALLVVSCASSPPDPAKGVETKTSATEPSPKPVAPAPSSEASSALVAPDVPAGAAAARDAVLVAEASRIVDAYTNVDPRLSPDGKKVVFRSDRDGLSQLYVADVAKPNAPAVRLTKTTERVSSTMFTSDGKTVVFLSDHGADENFSIFRIGIDGSGLTELTPGEVLSRDPPFLPDGAPNAMIYSARKREEPDTKVYVQPLEKGGAPKLVYTEKTPGQLTDVTRNGKRGLVLRYQSNSDTQLALLDLATGQAKTIYPRDGKKALVYAASFSNDGKTIFIATDDGQEGGFLLALDATSLEERARFSDASFKTGSIDELAVPLQGDRLAIHLDVGNRNLVRILDTKTLKPVAEVKLPLGSGHGLDAGRDGKTFSIAWSTPERPSDIQIIDARTGAIRVVPNEVRPALSGLDALEVTTPSVPSFDGTPIPVNIYKPKGGSAGTKKFPVIVAMHGGPSASSQVRWTSRARFFTAHGIVYIEPNVRGSTGFGRAYEQADDGPNRMVAVKDMEAIGKWVVSNAWADPSKLVVMGGSYGGYMTLMGVTHHPTLWKAGIDLFGVYDWRTFMGSTNGAIRSVFQTEIGPETDAAFLASVSPASRVDSIVVPLFVYAGANDPRVPRSESDQIVRSLRTRKVPVEYMVADNEGHSLDRKETLTAFLARSLRFIEDNLKLEKAPR